MTGQHVAVSTPSPSKQWLRVKRLNYMNGLGFGVATVVVASWALPSAWPSPAAVVFAVALVVVAAVLTVRGWRLGIVVTDRGVSVRGLARTRSAQWERIRAVVTPDYVVNAHRVMAGFELSDGTLLVSRSIGGSRAEIDAFADDLTAAARARTSGRVGRTVDSE